MMKRLAFSILLLSCSSLPAVSSSKDTSIQRLDGSRITVAEAERFAQKTLDEAHVTGAQIAVLQHGNRVWVHSFGLRNKEKNLPMNNDTTTWAASITKSVFASFVMQMVEAGVVEAGDGLRNTGEQVKVRPGGDVAAFGQLLVQDSVAV